MRFMILVKASAESEAGVMPPESLFTAMADYHEALAKAGVLVGRKRWSSGKIGTQWKLA